jgi:hypothetical protein
VLWTVIISAPGRVPDAPWNDPAAIRRHISEALPGTTFDGQVGSFSLSTYAITFTLTDDGGAIEVEATDARAEQAVIRAARNTGWQVLDALGQPLRIPGAATKAARSSVADRARPDAGMTNSPLPNVAMVAGFLVMAAASLYWFRAFEPATVTPPTTGPARVTTTAAMPAAAREPGSRGRLLRRFRDDPVAAQFVAYVDASIAFKRFHKEPYTWLDPAALAWPLRMTNRLDPIADALLPPSFRAEERDGYRFTFENDACGERPMRGAEPLAIDRCASATYVAIPLAPGKPSFAFRATDWQLRFRDDGVVPGPRDALAADFDPTHPDGPPPGELHAAPAASPSSAPSWVATMWATWEAAVGLRSTQPTEADHEREVVADLRAFAAAERAFAARAGGGHFTDIARLVEPMVIGRRTFSPALPAWHAQLERHGYRFEFTGTPTEDDWTRGVGRDLGPLFSAFQLVAYPDDRAARTLAVLTDGGIRVVTGRVPMPTDPLLQAP